MQNEGDVPRRQGRATRLSAKILLVSAGVLMGLLICEAALRIAGYTYPIFYEPDTARGYSLRPGMKGWYRKEGKAYVHINADGLRDREHEKRKPEGTLRIAVIGDSYAEALQVPQEKAFWAVLESRLRECGAFGGRQIEVVNFGVSGYGTAQELITLRRHVWDYSPDIVLLAVTTINDITDNSRAFKKTDEIPYFVLRGGELSLDESFRETSAFRLRNSTLNRAGRWIRDHLRFVQAIHESHGALKSALARLRAPKPVAPQPEARTGAVENRANSPAAAADELGVDNMVYREPNDAAWRDAWAVTEKLIVTMRDEVKERGAEFLVVTLSNAVQVVPNPSVRAELMQRLGVGDLFYPERRIKSLGEREGFPVFNLAPVLQQHAERNKIFLHGTGEQAGNGHWNETGHALGGELIARELCGGSSGRNAH